MCTLVVSIEHNVLLGSLWLLCLLGFLFAIVCTADSYLHWTFLVLLFFLFSVSCCLTNKDEYFHKIRWKGGTWTVEETIRLRR